jgi:hypothetical protein
VGAIQRVDSILSGMVSMKPRAPNRVMLLKTLEKIGWEELQVIPV